MNTLEDRLRDAYREAAETVRPEGILSDALLCPPDRARRRARHTGRAGHGASRSRRLIPLAAGTAVIAVVAVVAVLLPRTGPGPGGGKPADRRTTPALLTTPAYFVVLNWSQHPSMFVATATTGAQGARISLPFPSTDLTSVATGDGQTFVVAATAPGSSSTSLYRFTLAANGTPSPMTPFTTVRGQIDGPSAMAVSANGEFIAYRVMTTDEVATPRRPQHGYLAVLDTVTGHTKQWTFRTAGYGFMTGTGNVSISASGSVAGFGNEVVDTSAAPGSLAARGRVVATDNEFGPSTIVGSLNVSPDGTTVYFETNAETAYNKPVWTSWQLRAFDLATGQTRLIRSFPGTEGGAGVTFDPTGRYMLVESVINTGTPTKPLPTTKLAVVDVATGQLAQLNASWAVDPEIAW